MHRFCVFLFGIITPFLFIACLGASETANAPEEYSNLDDTMALLSLTIVKGDLSMDSIYLVIIDGEGEFLVVENGVEPGAATIFFELTIPQSRDITLQYVCFNNGAVVARKSESVIALGELSLESVPDEMPTLFSAGNDTIIALKERYTVPIIWVDNSFHVSYAIQFVESQEFTKETSHIYKHIGTYPVVVHAFDGYNNVFDTVVVTVENNRVHVSSFAVADNPSSSRSVPLSSMVSVSSTENVSSNENISTGTAFSASSEAGVLSSSSSAKEAISSVAVVQSSDLQGTSSMQGPSISSATVISSQEILSSQESQTSSSATPILYTVIFDGNGSNALVPPGTVAPGSLLTEPSAPIQSGYTFDGWYNGNTLWDFSQGVTTDLTLQARWTVITYSVSFNLNGGNASIASATVNAGSTVARPTAPTRDGYTFVGWYNGASEWNFSSGVNRNLTMIAEWDILSYAISLQSENTSWLTLSRSSVGVSHGVPQSVSVTSTPSDMIDSWSSTTGCIIITQSPLQMSCTQNATLTARFKRVAVTSAAISGASFDTLHTVGNTLQLSGAVLPSNAFDKSISWSSDNDDVASVSNGLVFANGIGEATITLHTSNNAVIAQKKIYVQTLSGSLSFGELRNTEVTPLSTGNFIMTYASEGGTAYYRLLSATGTTLGTERTIKSGNVYGAYAAELSNGNILLVWGGGGDKVSGFKIINQTGATVVADTDLKNSANTYFSIKGAVAFSGGNWAITYSHNNNDHYIGFYSNSGALVNTNSIGSGYYTTVLRPLSNGNMFLLILKMSISTGNHSLEGTVFTNNGTVHRSDLGITSSSVSGATVQEKSNGTFDVLYRSNLNNRTEVARYWNSGEFIGIANTHQAAGHIYGAAAISGTEYVYYYREGNDKMDFWVPGKMSSTESKSVTPVWEFGRGSISSMGGVQIIIYEDPANDDRYIYKLMNLGYLLE